jgi:hypothetical protein
LSKSVDLVVADDAFPQDRLVDEAEDGCAAVAQADERDVERHARKEGLGPVDRIQHPAELGVGVLRPELLAEDAMTGVGALDGRAHDPLGLLVGHRHRSAVGLDLDLRVEPGMGRGEDAAGEVGQGLGKVRQLPLAGFVQHVQGVRREPPASKRKGGTA